MRQSAPIVAISLFVLAVPAAGQRPDRPARPSRDASADTQRGETERFTPALHAGQSLSVSNVDGDVTVTQGHGEGAEIVARKIVRHGDAERIRAVLEPTDDGYRVCTVYLDRASDDAHCDTRNSRHQGDHERDNLDAEIRYEIRLPAGVAIHVHTVDGNIDARGLDTEATIQTVDGDVTFSGVAPSSLGTVDGKITATISPGRWSHDLAIRTVDGDIDLTLPGNAAFALSGDTVDGDVRSDFPITMTGKWGPHSFHGTVGGSADRTLSIHTVDGAIRLHNGAEHH